MKSWIVICALLAPCLPALAQDFRGRLIFSLEELEWALEEHDADGSRRPGKGSGIFCYYEEARTVSSGPSSVGVRLSESLTCHKLRDGKSVGVAGPGFEELKGILQTLYNSPLSTFSVQNEIDSVRAKLQVSGGPKIIVKDGAKYRIRYDFNGAGIDHTGWNAGTYIRLFAPYSENLRNLNEVINVFALLYGRRQFGL